MKSIRPFYLPYWWWWWVVLFCFLPTLAQVLILTPPYFYCLCFFYLWGATQLQSFPIPCSLHSPAFPSRPVTWNYAWITFSVDKAAVLFFKSPLDRTSTKEWTFHRADFCLTEGKNPVTVRDGLPHETMGSPWLHTFKERPDTTWQEHQRSEVLV